MVNRSLLVAALMGVATSFSSGAVVLQQNFDDTSEFVPEAPIDNVTLVGLGGVGGSWYNQNSTVNLAATAGRSLSPGQSIRAIRDGDGTGRLLGFTGSPGDTINTGTLTVSAYIYREPGASTTLTAINGYSLGGYAAYAIEAYVLTDGAIGFYFNNGVSEGYDFTSTVIAEDTWTGIQFQIDFDNLTGGIGKYKAFVDGGSGFDEVGEFAFDTSALAALSPNWGVDGIALRPQATGTVYLDDALIATVPEPGIMCVMATLSIVTLRRRARA